MSILPGTKAPWFYLFRFQDSEFQHTKSKAVTAMDVVYALKRQGSTLYGFRASFLKHIN